MKLIDLSGQRFGRWTVLHRCDAPEESNRVYWLCKCDCGNTKAVMGSALRSGKTKSCGCLSREKLIERNTTQHAIHRMTGIKLYKTWTGIKNRCYNQKSAHYQNYGKRGISMCEEWRNSFVEFNKWCRDNGYRVGLSIDRINNDGDYEPDNCRWVTQDVQANNRRSVVYIEYDNTTMSMSEWARLKGMSLQVLRYRLNAGWPTEKALETPTGGKGHADA
jgi:hypothetical protein